MRRRVPLNAVRAFEAAARHKNLIRAADELCVTPTAISHQIRLLEDFLQAKVFIRKNSRLDLTLESREALSKLTEALDLIDDVVRNLSLKKNAREMISVGASASLASLWLMPRMSGFFDSEPQLDVSLTTFMRRTEIEGTETDLWICNWQTDVDRRIEPLMEEDIVPVCTPQLARQFGPQASDILKQAPLIHVDRLQWSDHGPYPDWARYLREFGVTRSDLSKGARFNQAAAAIEAAKAGLGVLLGRSILMEQAVQAGQLVQIADAYPIRSSYFLVSPWETTAGGVNKFKDWLFQQAGFRAAVHA